MYINDNKVEIFTLNNAIRMIAYCMRYQHRRYYKKLEKSYEEDFSYDSVMFDV